jgi:class 3 adenylate cyclase
MATATDLEGRVDDVFGTTFDERVGKVVPSTTDVTLKNGAVKIEATFLYADLAGSANLSRVCPWDTTAKIIRAFLDCSTRLIRARGGEIRSFDGDRVMGVFMGDLKNSQAADCAREINYAVTKIIDPKAKARFQSIRNNGIDIRHAVGIDVGDVRAVRAGIRANNDLVWIGKAASMAAKLSDCREYPYTTFISSRTYAKLRDSSKLSQGKNMWESGTFTFGGVKETVYRSSWWRRP